MSKDKFILYCKVCDFKWECPVDKASDLHWECPKCKGVEHTVSIGYTPSNPKEFYERVMKWEGGTKHA